MPQQVNLVGPFFLLIIIVLIITTVKKKKGNNEAGENFSENTIEKLRQSFIEPAETYIASFGNRYITQSLSGIDKLKGFAVLTNDNLYIKGDCTYKNTSNEKIVCSEYTIKIADVQGFKNSNEVFEIFHTEGTVSFNTKLYSTVELAEFKNRLKALKR